jgi:hypothetical protein
MQHQTSQEQQIENMIRREDSTDASMMSNMEMMVYNVPGDKLKRIPYLVKYHKFYASYPADEVVNAINTVLEEEKDERIAFKVVENAINYLNNDFEKRYALQNIRGINRFPRIRELIPTALRRGSQDNTLYPPTPPFRKPPPVRSDSLIMQDRKDRTARGISKIVKNNGSLEKMRKRDLLDYLKWISRKEFEDQILYSSEVNPVISYLKRRYSETNSTLLQKVPGLVRFNEIYGGRKSDEIVNAIISYLQNETNETIAKLTIVPPIIYHMKYFDNKDIEQIYGYLRRKNFENLLSYIQKKYDHYLSQVHPSLR